MGTTKNRLILSLAILLGWLPGILVAQDVEVTFGEELRITGATVLRGGPAAPPAIYPTELQGSVIGMRGDTLLFETGNEPVYWIPLRSGFPLVERRGEVSDVARLTVILGAVSGLAGATFGWGLHNECFVSQTVQDLGISGDCGEIGSAGGSALKGFAIGAGIGVTAGLVLSRFARRMTWLPLPVQNIRYSEGPLGSSLSVRLPTGGRPVRP